MGIGAARRRPPLSALGVAAAVTTLMVLATPVHAAVPDPGPPTTTVGASDDGTDAGTDGGGQCSLPTSWDELTSPGRMGCVAKEAATVAGWVAAAALGAYLVLGVVLRPVPLRSRRGTLGTLRRAREALPLVGRAYRPRVELQVVDTAGETGPLARSIHELLIEEMRPASDDAWFSERLTGDNFGADLAKALDVARPGLGAVGSFLTRLLPQERVGMRIQLHEPTPATVSLTAELLDRGRRSAGSRVFRSRRLTIGDDPVTTDHYLLIRPVAAWLAFQLYDIWPGDADEPPKPMNTENAESFGEFRRGELLQTINRPSLARSAYHGAISLDSDNVGALVNLALLDSRDRQRVGWTWARLSDARVLVDAMRDEVERAELRTRIQHVQVVARMNALMWDESTLSDAELLTRLAGCAGGLQVLAQTIRDCATAGVVAAAQPARRRTATSLSALGRSYEHRAIALAACLAVENERIGVHVVRATPCVDSKTAIGRLSHGSLLAFDECLRVLDRPGQPISTAATYILACAYARRIGVPNAVRARRQALSFLREALAGDPSMRAWVEHPDGDPAFCALRGEEGWADVFVDLPPALDQVAALATST